MTKLTFGEWLSESNKTRPAIPIELHFNNLYDEYQAYLEQPKPFPQEDDTYWYLDATCVRSCYWQDDPTDKDLLERGNVYQTEAEAETADKKRIARATIERWAKEKNGDWKPDWSDRNQHKYTVLYGTMSNELQVDDFVYIHKTLGEVCYKDEATAKLAIEELAEEYLILIGKED